MTKDDGAWLITAGARKALIVGFGGLSSIFIAGILTGYVAGMMDDDHVNMVDMAYVGGFVALIAAIAVAGWKFWPEDDGEPVAASTKKSQNILLFALLFGAMLGVILGIAEGPDVDGIFSNNTLSAGMAGLLLAIWVTVMPAMTWFWWRTIDEHEATAYREGAFWSVHLYLMIVPAWWIAARAGWLPPQDPMIVFLIISGIWSAIWLYRRYF